MFTVHRPDALTARAHCVTCGKRARVLVDHEPVCMAHVGTPCDRCGRFIRVGMWATCRTGPHDHGQIRTRDAQGFDPVIVHYDPVSQQYRFPSATDAKMPPGYVRQELRTTAEVRKFQRAWNASERQKVDARMSREQAHRDAREQRNRGTLRMAMQGMSRFGRDFARTAMNINNQRRPQTYDPGCYIESFEMDRSNREPQRDARTGWKRGRD